MSSLMLMTAAVVALSAPPEAAKLGEKVPAFTVAGADGKTYSPSALEGKFVVLEWTNKDCPYVARHYREGTMQATQAKAKEMGAVWLAVSTSSEGKQGYLPAEGHHEHLKAVKSSALTVLLDPDGKLGRIFDAKTTPQIAIIDPAGKLIYNGAIDDQPEPRPGAAARNHVLEALKEAMAGKAVTVATSKPYGCGVKYPD
ncbi:MAG TPA: redoxin domain-containing protein [Fimbriimonas sp.]